jgi:cell division protease FtsH
MYFLISYMDKQSMAGYQYSDFLNDTTAGNVISVVIRQNNEIPTGRVTVSLKNGLTKAFYVGDINDIVDYCLEKGITYTLQDVSRPSFFLTSILPYLIRTAA